MSDALPGRTVTDSDTEGLIIGNRYDWNHKTPAKINDNAYFDFIMVTGETDFYLTAQTEIFGSVLSEIFINPIYSNIGTLKNFRNKSSHYLTKLPEMKIYINPTVSNPGELWYDRDTIGSNTNQVKSIPTSSNDPKVFKANSVFYVRITNKSEAASYIVLKIEGYEDICREV